MLFIPVGLDRSEVRRVPWVSFSLIGVNVLVFLILWLASYRSSAATEVSEKAEAVARYLGQRPYLSIPHELEPYLDAHSRRQLDLARAAAARGRPVDFVVRRQQQTFNDMVADLFASVRRLPLLRWGYVPGDPHADRLLTCLFVHAGWLHLIGNMLFLFATGPFLEDVYGRALFTLLYFSSGLIATQAHVWQNPGSLAPIVGASGAIAGVLGAFLVRLGTTRIRFCGFLFLCSSSGACAWPSRPSWSCRSGSPSSSGWQPADERPQWPCGPMSEDSPLVSSSR